MVILRGDFEVDFEKPIDVSIFQNLKMNALTVDSIIDVLSKIENDIIYENIKLYLSGKIGINVKFDNKCEVLNFLVGQCGTTGVDKSCEIVELLINTTNNNINIKDLDENLLHAFKNIKTSSPVMVRKLIEMGAFVNHMNYLNETPLILACTDYELSGGRETFQMLFDHGALVNSKTTSGVSALIRACQAHYCSEKSIEMVELLIDAGADIEIENSSKSTPLMISVCNGSDVAEKIVKYFLNKNANIHHVDNNNDTCLTFACKYFTGINSKNIIKILLDAGANVNNINNGGNTPLTLLCQLTDIPDITDAIEMLISVGADVNHTLKLQNPIRSVC